MRLSIFLSTIFLSTILTCLNAQNDISSFKEGDFVLVKLEGGSEVRGKVVAIKSEFIVLESNTLGQLTLRYSNILDVSLSNKEFFHETNSDQFDNPLSNKNFISETAFGLKKGEKLFQNVMLGGQGFTYGITDNFNLGGGIEFFSLVQQQAPIVFISPKYIFHNESRKINFGIGTNLILAPEGSRTTFAGTIYGLATFGNRDENITVGLGYAFYAGESTESPVIQIGGMTRLSRKIMIVADHVLISDHHNSEFGGTWTIRFISSKFSIDVGAAIQYSAGAIPVFGGSLKF